MEHYKTSLFLLAIASFFGLTTCQNQPAKPNPALSNVELLRGEIIMCGGEELGEVNFSVPCKYSVRETFGLAMSLLHSFEYDEAEKAFVKVIDGDPDCAMAYWGVAMSIYHALWAPPSEEGLKKGKKMVDIAASIPKTDKEKAYLEAIGLYYQDWETLDAKTRASKMANKMAAIHQQYPDDTEAAILYALALNSTADPTDKNYTKQKQAGRILETIFPNQPNHPGVAHYLIHTYDYPILAEKALSTARKYAKIAPASAHAQHMPSHIFTRMGLWDESISSNLDATASAVCYAKSAGFPGHWDEELHGMDYLVYAYLQQGDNDKANAQNSYLNTMDTIQPANFKVAYALAAIPARIALENKDWSRAANLAPSSIEFRWVQFPWQKAIVHFTRALGAAHLGNTQKAAAEITTLQTLHQNLVDKGIQYEANQVLIQLKAATAWLHFAKGNNQEALALMREAADMEDSTTKHPVTPCEVLPARELLGDLLLASNKPAEALIAYEKDLADHPQRFNGLYGAALAAQKLGKSAQAKLYFEKLIKIAEPAGHKRPEIAVAKEALSGI